MFYDVMCVTTDGPQLNALAEITRFADRGFYADWWNSVSWDQFSRDWNRPVYNFLLRHVYHSSISPVRVYS
jgi:sterol O-acyltransferase